MKHLVLVLLVLPAVAAAPVASAQSQADAAYYGLALGNFDYAEGDGLGGDFLSDSVSSYRLMVGYRFMEHLGVEGGYGETGTIRDTASLPVFGGGTAALSFASEIKIFTIRLLGVLPFDNGLSLVGGLSYADIRQDIDFSLNNGPTQSFDDDRNEPAYYVGAQYDWDRFAIRLGYEKYDLESDIDVDETMITFFYKL